ncbi:MAG: prohibitin family protein [Caldilineaceae bacterium]|nr:prohibitin family protein [Caldilineaceae bacterium]MBP8107242.1 prohibitin family protein [Caldilineaceae bacterium]MBP8121360.1 prohibitin family protein [Caldilineaceae bacterium]MBP9070665.1 prohibitin family protein [Caldilineaceae bacterium]
MVQNNIDLILNVAAKVGWALFAIYAITFFLVAVRKSGWAPAVIRLFSFRVLLPLMLALGIQLLSMAIVFVLPQQVGVIVSVISPGGVRPQPVRAGLHWIIPFLEQDIMYPISWQTYTMSSTPGEGVRLTDDSIRSRTSDGQEVSLDCSIIFRLDQDQAVTVHVDWQERYAEDFVRPVVRAIVRRQVSQFTAREVNSSARTDLEAALDRILAQEFNDKGLVLDQFLLRDIAFTPEYSDAVESKQVALEGQAQTEYEAQQMRNLATGRADAIEIEANAKAAALDVIGVALSENRDLITYEYVQKLSPNIKVMLVPSSSPLILSLPDMGITDELTATESISGTMPITTTVTTP